MKHTWIQKMGTIIPSIVLWTTQKVILITFKCRTNEPFITLGYANTKGTQDQGPS